MDAHVSRRLEYAAAVACGMFASLALHILLTVFGVGLDQALRPGIAQPHVQLITAFAWWAVAAAGFLGGWGTGVYLIVAAREHALLTRIAQRVLIALVFAVATAGGIMSKSGAGGTPDVVAGLSALGVGLLCAYCGARLAYLNAEQI